MNSHFFRKISETRRQYIAHKMQDEISGEWGAIIFYRWISFPISALFLLWGIPANVITWLSIFLSLLLPFTLLFNPDVAYIYLAIGAILISILDCVDGNIARVTNTTSKKGQYLDFFADIIYRLLLYITLGFIVHAVYKYDSFLISNAALFCLLAAVLAIVARLCRVYAESRFPDVRQEISADDHNGADNNAKSYIFKFISGLDHLLPIFILFAGVYGFLFWVMIWILFYSLLDFMYTQWSIIRRLP